MVETLSGFLASNSFKNTVVRLLKTHSTKRVFTVFTDDLLVAISMDVYFIDISGPLTLYHFFLELSRIHTPVLPSDHLFQFSSGSLNIGAPQSSQERTLYMPSGM